MLDTHTYKNGKIPCRWTDISSRTRRWM